MNTEENLTDNQQDTENKNLEPNLPENANENQQDADTLAAQPIPEEKVLSEIDPDAANTGNDEELQSKSKEEILAMMKEQVADKNSSDSKKFNYLKELVSKKIEELGEFADEKLEKFKNEFAEVQSSFREKHSEFMKIQSAQQEKNVKEREEIITKLKNLYTNSEPGTNLFKEIRTIKDAWTNAGKVPPADFKTLNNNYFHHLNQFYQMLDLNKEFLEQEYAHNLEKRNHIIDRAKQLIDEPSIQKALNEIQYLHRLWKEEAEPVAEEFRENTWQEFREISNKIQERRTELNQQNSQKQEENLAKKNSIIASIKVVYENIPSDAGHKFWQDAIKKVEAFRAEFLAVGSVPKNLSNQSWNDFKETLKNFNTAKNNYYKNLKGDQQQNLDNKLKLIDLAKENMHSEDWETAVPLFKKLQDDWKKIGHVPRNLADKIWEDFRGACNTFFDKFREKTNAEKDDWKANFETKKSILEELKNVEDGDNSVAKIEEIKNRWNSVGKVPKENMDINGQFNKLLRDKLRQNKASEFDLKESGLSEIQVSDKARKVKNQITDLEAEIVKLENNLGFFADSSKNNPLLKSTYDNIDSKKSQVENLKKTLHDLLSQ